MAYGVDTDAMAADIISAASNLPPANSSSFSVVDFVTFFPQFGVASNISSISLNDGGTGYQVDDVLTVVQSGASGGTAQVTSISAGGVITGIILRNAGQDYTTFNGLATTVDPTGGTGCLVNIVTNPVNVSTELLDMFLAMAYSSVLESRWKAKWKFAMSLYMAHFLTLWLRTQNGPNETAAQIIGTAQTAFATASKSVGEVSVSYDTSSISGSLPGWGMWTTTSYGAQLAQLAAFLTGAKAGMYVR